MLWRAGLRISEALALAESDLDAARCAILVRCGKGGKRREVGMDPWAWEQLAPWLRLRSGLPVGALFCVIHGATQGRAWSAPAAREQLRRIAARAGVRRRFAPHQLRHAHAVEMAREGVPLVVIQRQLGHANLGITSVYLQGIDNAEIIDTVHARRAPMIPASAGLRTMLSPWEPGHRRVVPARERSARRSVARRLLPRDGGGARAETGGDSAPVNTGRLVLRDRIPGETVCYLTGSAPAPSTIQQLALHRLASPGLAPCAGQFCVDATQRRIALQRHAASVTEAVVFHVDRTAALGAGMLLAAQDGPAMPADVPALHDEWPGGLTAHGLRYAPSATFNGETVSEWFFELVRRAEFPEARSRFQSLFAMASLADARAFRHAVGGNLSIPIFRVRGVVTHRANMNLIRWTAPAVATLGRAREYWRGEQGIAAPLWEVLLEPPVTVLDRVDETENVCDL